MNFVYFGGGTPSFLSTQQLESLVTRLTATTSWSEAEEITFECEPGTLSETSGWRADNDGERTSSMGDAVATSTGRFTTGAGLGSAGALATGVGAAMTGAGAATTACGSAIFGITVTCGSGLCGADAGGVNGVIDSELDSSGPDSMNGARWSALANLKPRSRRA